MPKIKDKLKRLRVSDSETYSGVELFKPSQL